VPGAGTGIAITRPLNALETLGAGRTLRTITPDELEAWRSVQRRTFGGNAIEPQDLERSRLITEYDRAIAVFEGKNIVATAGGFSQEMTVPGGLALSTAAVSAVAVLPTHRRQGLLSVMMRRQLDDAHERGQPLAALYASETGIYGRFGYGLSTYAADLKVDRFRSDFVASPNRPTTFRLADPVEAAAAFSAVFDECRLQRNGTLSMSPRFWQSELLDPPDRRAGMSEHYRVVCELDGRPAAFALYRLKPGWTDNQPDYRLLIYLLMANSPDSYAAIWSYCFGVDLVSQVEAPMRPVDEELRFLLRDPRAMRMDTFDAIWLRLVDAKAALAGRRYSGPGRLVIDLRDEFCPWNQGRLLLEAERGSSRCQQTDAAPDIALDTRDLSAAYLGGNSFQMLHRAGLVDEQRPGALSLADALFHTDRAPWCPTHF
jgi:predicted acetyltransferase